MNVNSVVFTVNESPYSVFVLINVELRSVVIRRHKRSSEVGGR